jgi:predicted phosphohydrolase
MRIFAVSDLHADVCDAGDCALRTLARRVNAEGRPGDVLLIGGDIAIDDAGIARCLDLFAPFAGAKGAVAGNHDIWVRGSAHASSLARHVAVQDIFRSRNFVPLEEEAMVVDGIGFVGAMGWYDGTFKDPGLHIDDHAYETKTLPGTDGPIWADAIRARWGATDAEVSAWQIRKLEARLAEVRGAREVVALVHHVPTKRLLPYPHARWLVPAHWRFANAFLGSERLSETLAKVPEVRTVVNGHIHRSGGVSHRGARYVSIGGDYDAKQLLVIDRGRVGRQSFAP